MITKMSMRAFSPPTWGWYCGGQYNCGFGDPKDGTWESALVAAKAHAKGKHKVDLDKKEEVI
jgi:hypothetical protein